MERKKQTDWGLALYADRIHSNTHERGCVLSAFLSKRAADGLREVPGVLLVELGMGAALHRTGGRTSFSPFVSLF